MISNWFILALSTSTSLGLIAFINKIFAERKYDKKYSVMILQGILAVFSILYLFYSGVNHVSISYFILAMLWGIQMYVYNFIMMAALRYLPTSTFFINIRLISSFILLFIGILFFKDIISNNEWVGFVLGVFAMILLFEKENKRDSDYKKGIMFLLFGVVALIFGHTITKYFSYNIEFAPTIMAISFISSFLFALLVGYKTISENKPKFKPIFLINIVQASLYFFYFVILFYVYKLGDLGISYKIQSYSPFIPIILSAIIYKEKITKKKMIAIVLTILSLWFFI